MRKFATLIIGTAAIAVSAQPKLVETAAYYWQGDSIIQDRFKAYAPNDTMIISDYYAQPGFFMGIDQVWKLRNNISGYPALKSPNRLHNAIYNMALDEMVNAVEPDTTLRTGKEWAGVWTRDVSYSILLSMAYMQPEASRISLMKKVSPTGRIIQDTGSGGAWPVSSDRMVWALAAYEIYKVTGDKEWLTQVYPVITNSFEDDWKVVFDPETGLIRGETSFIDWREQSYPKWMQTADIYRSEAMGTSVVHSAAYQVTADMATILGKKKEAALWSERAKTIADGINKYFWMPDKGYYGMYLYGRDNPYLLNPRSETLGESLAILYGIASPEQALSITVNAPVTKYGSPIFFPGISDMPAYHNNALWPFVASFWALANAKAGNPEGTLQAIGSVYRPAALFATNKENLNLDNGDIATELNSSNMLWCLSGNIAITTRVLFGIHFGLDGLRIAPFVPESLSAERSLTNFPYRGAKVNITISGFGNEIAECTVNGKKSEPFIAADGKLDGKTFDIVIRLADKKIAEPGINMVVNEKAPLTPITRIEGDYLVWNPIEYIAGYKVLRDGKVIAETRSTSFRLTEPGEYQVIGISGKGTESFASEPLSNRKETVITLGNGKTVPSSAEISYQPKETVAGFRGNGFAETDTESAPLEFTVNIPETGTYSFTFVYSNGNGPVNTENKCAIRTLVVDGKASGTVVMPTRGVANWNDWGNSAAVTVPLEKGTRRISVEYRPENRNMNLKTNHALIDRVIVRKI